MTLINSENYKAKFRKGDIVYYVGDMKPFRNIPLEVLMCVPMSEAHYNITIKFPNGNKNNDITENFISKEEYLKDKNTDKISNFKVGDIVYYNYPDQSFSHHTPFRLWANGNYIYFDIFIDKKKIPISADFVNKRFISEEDYKKKYGVTRQPESEKVEQAQVSNYDTFVRGIKKDDVVYYMGDKIPRFQNNVPYKVEFINPLTGLIKIEGGISPSEDFVLAEDYERIKMNDPKSIKSDKGKSKSDIEIKMVVFTETNDGKMKWFEPYASQQDWYRSTVKLDIPPDSYLRYDLLKTKMEGKWIMKIYYHRNKPSVEAKNNGIQIKEFDETQLLKNLAETIKKLLEKEKRENLSFQDTDN